MGTAHSWANWVASTIAKFLLFFVMPIMVEVMLLEGACIWIGLMLVSAVGVLEWVRTWFTLLGFKSRRISFLIHFATLCKLAVMFRFVKAIALDIFCLLESAQKYYMSSLPAILTLRDAWVYIGTPNSDNVALYVETPYCHFGHLIYWPK